MTMLATRLLVLGCTLAPAARTQAPPPSFVSATNPFGWRATAADNVPFGTPVVTNDLPAASTAPLSVFAINLSSAQADAGWDPGDLSFDISAEANGGSSSGSNASIGGFGGSSFAEVVATFDATQPWIGQFELAWSITANPKFFPISGPSSGDLRFDMFNDGSFELTTSEAGSGVDTGILDLPAGIFEVRFRFRTSASINAFGRVSASLTFGDVPGTTAPYGSGCRQPSFYEEFTTSFDLDGETVALIPNSAGGYDVLYGSAPIDTDYGTSLMMTDDDIVTQPLGFTFTIPGHGDVTDIVIDSNGRCGPLMGSEFQESVADFLAEPMYAVFWDDFDPTLMGDVFVKQVPASVFLPFARTVVSWVDVPEFGMTDSNTFQATFYEFGPVVFNYGAMDTTDGIVGFSSGLSLLDPGESNLSFSPQISTGLVQPLVLEGLNVPTIGEAFDMTTSGYSPGAAAAALIWAGAQTALPLDLIGAPRGCELLVDLVDFTLPIDIVTGDVSFSVPTINSWIGRTFYLQAVAADFSIQANVPVTLSNGLEIQIGQ